jgi:hypothetical protein
MNFAGRDLAVKLMQDQCVETRTDLDDRCKCTPSRPVCPCFISIESCEDSIEAPEEERRASLGVLRQQLRAALAQPGAA